MTTPHRRRYRRLRRGRLGAGLFLTVCLSALAGMTDAIGLMMIGSYVSFMSGNTTEFAAALVRGQYQHAAMLAAILFVFVAGNALGEIFIRLTRRNHVPLLFVTAVLIAVPMALPGAVWPMLAAVLAMGMLNSGIEQVEGQAFGITFITGALSRFGRGIGRWLMGRLAADGRCRSYPSSACSPARRPARWPIAPCRRPALRRPPRSASPSVS